jgi:hypothetical protein
MRLIKVALCITILSLTCAQAQQVSSRKPTGLILSTGNLYFTSHDAAGAAVWRTSQTSVPGQESVLYWEQGAKFGDIVFAQVNGAFFGYFFAEKGGVISIKRVPLSGGNAITLATVTSIDIVNSRRNLVTDGINLYWQDATAVRKMPINGGAMTVLDQTTPSTPTAGILLQNNRIIYASVNKIIFVPTAGAITGPLVRTLVTAGTRVTALHSGPDGIYWGEQNGAVRRKNGAIITTLDPSGPVPTSISTDAILAPPRGWTECTSSTCQLRVDLLTGNGSTPINADALGLSVKTSGSNVLMFWGDAAGVHRKRF